MFRLLLALCLVVPCAHADRAEYLAARDKLEEAYFDELDPDERDQLFMALGTYDHKQVAKEIGEIASRFGAYVDSLEAKIAAIQEKLGMYTSRSALTDQEIGLRNSHIRKLDKLEEVWARARKSESQASKLSPVS